MEMPWVNTKYLYQLVLGRLMTAEYRTRLIDPPSCLQNTCISLIDKKTNPLILLFDMAHKPNLGFRVPKYEKMRAAIRRPKGFLRPSLVHKDAKSYSRTKTKQNLQKQLKEES